jgi:4-oxalocrotonate tautomerase family enzyme|nr:MULTISPECIES: tautomerase family protein [unclassified Marinobacter]
MPIAQLYIIEGRTDEQKETLIQEVSEAMARSSGMNNAGQMVSGFEGG